MVLTADLRVGSRYRITIGASVTLMSAPIFGSQPLTTQAPGTPDSLTFGIATPRSQFVDVLGDRLPDDTLRIIVEPAVRYECARS